MGYQTCINRVSASLVKAKKGAFPPFPFSIGMWKIENVRQAKDEVNVLSSCKFKEVNFQRHDLEGFFKEYLKQLNITWPYSHKDLQVGELSQHGVLIKSKIPTLEKMVWIDKEFERKKDEIEKNKYIMEWHLDASWSSISLYNIDSDNEDTACASSWTPSLIREITPPLEQGEEMVGSQPL